ncbi:MAG: XRE family transcriptional regulator [Pedobacter sp.]|nr:MAG: XRE family transcriptional regulator [Pedobacter sp.]
MDDTKYKLISKRIRLARNRLGFSQEYIAQELGISQNVYSNNERNVKNIPIYRLEQIAKILGVSIIKLLED